MFPIPKKLPLQNPCRPYENGLFGGDEREPETHKLRAVPPWLQRSLINTVCPWWIQICGGLAYTLNAMLCSFSHE